MDPNAVNLMGQYIADFLQDFEAIQNDNGKFNPSIFPSVSLAICHSVKPPVTIYLSIYAFDQFYQGFNKPNFYRS